MIPEVLDIFISYTVPKNIPPYLVDLERLCLVNIDAVRHAYLPTIASIREVDIERHTSYANQRREDVIQMIVKGIIKYAVLSHTWDGKEFLRRDMTSGTPRTGPSWEKLEQFFRIARDSFRCRFAWADTVCIDYSSTADRQLAAQFLFSWYRDAYVCIAYLAEVHALSAMGHSKWFSRGFTLTELVAPIRMKFYGAEWRALNNVYIENDKADESFLQLLSTASGIPISDLRMFWSGSDRIRDKLSWASGRTTARVEDTAYSLMALFDSRIPICYGEGDQAFARLMIDIIPKSGECDVFAWAGPCSVDHPGLPRSPAGFAEQRNVQKLNPTPHHYRLCGDRSVFIGPNYLRIKVILLDVTLKPSRARSFQFCSSNPSVSTSDVNLLRTQEIGQLTSAGTRWAIGVIDYGWGDDPDKGVLRNGNQYFCFLLHKNGENDSQWKKLETEKVVFLSTTSEGLVLQELTQLELGHPAVSNSDPLIPTIE